MAFEWDKVDDFFTPDWVEPCVIPSLNNQTFCCIRSKVDAMQEFAEMGVYPKLDFALMFKSSDFEFCGRPKPQALLVYKGITYRIKNDTTQASDSTGKTFTAKLEAQNQ